jgi:hypothetical protein
MGGVIKGLGYPFCTADPRIVPMELSVHCVRTLLRCRHDPTAPFADLSKCKEQDRNRLGSAAHGRGKRCGANK